MVKRYHTTQCTYWMHCVRITVNNLPQVLKNAGNNNLAAYLGDENGIDLGVVFEIL